MSRAVFALGWLGGAAERAFAAHHRDADDLPWGTLDTRGFSDAHRDLARISWTASAHQEWCAAASFAALLQAMLVAGAPVDLVGMAGRFVADEMFHVELNARMASEVGGGVALQVDPHVLVPAVDPGLDALERACTLAVRVSCVGETFSLPLLAATRAACDAPLTRAVLSRIVRDEGPHALVGWLLLDWALPRLSVSARERLAFAATDAVAALRASYEPAPPRPSAEAQAAGRALGWLSPPVYARRAEAVISRRIVWPFAARGLQVH